MLILVVLQSADTRTDNARALQVSLLEMQLCGVLPGHFDNFTLGRGLENSMPLEVVRGAMVIRVNSLTRSVLTCARGAA